MASVSIRTGHTSTTPLAEVQPEEWEHIMWMRREFCEQKLPSDCRMLLSFVDDGRAIGFAGYENEDAYIRDGLGLEPEAVRWAIEGLKILDDEEPVELEHAVETGKLGQHGGDRRSADQGDNITLKERGTSADYTLARLKRDRPDLAERVMREELSANAAAIEAGFRERKIPIPLDPERAAAALKRHFKGDDFERLLTFLMCPA